MQTLQMRCAMARNHGKQQKQCPYWHRQHSIMSLQNLIHLVNTHTGPGLQTVFQYKPSLHIKELLLGVTKDTKLVRKKCVHLSLWLEFVRF